MIESSELDIDVEKVEFENILKASFHIGLTICSASEQNGQTMNLVLIITQFVYVFDRKTAYVYFLDYPLTVNALLNKAKIVLIQPQVA